MCYNIIVGKMSDGVRLFVIAFIVCAMLDLEELALFDFKDLSELLIGFQS